MSLYLNSVGETGSFRYAAELHYLLDERYYPKYVRDTGVGVYFEALGSSLFELDQNITATYQDQFIASCKKNT